MDEIDRAQKVNEAYQDAALRSHRAKREAELVKREATACADCGRPIPKGRLKASPSATRCVSCQEKFEHGDGGGLDD